MSDRRHNLQHATTIRGTGPHETPWVWKGYLAKGTITILSAGYKIGKSTLMTLLWNAMRTGGTLAGEKVAMGRVAIASEEPKEVWLDRFEMYPQHEHLDVEIIPFPVPPPREEWKSYVKSFHGEPFDLFVFDSLGHFLPPNAESSLTEVRHALEPVRGLASTGVSVAVLHQPSKRNRGEFNLSGHGRVDADPDILMELKLPHGEPADSRLRRLQVRSRLTYKPPIRMLELDAEGRTLSVLTVPHDPDSFEAGWPLLKMVLEDATERLKQKDILAEWPPDFQKPSFSTIKRMLDRAVEEKKVERFCDGRPKSPFRYALPGKKFRPYDFGSIDPDADFRERYGL